MVRALAALAVALAAADTQYEVKRTGASREVLLDTAGIDWPKAPVIEWGPGRYRTTFRALWSDAGLHVAFEARDPEPWHTLTRHDDHLWTEEVVEIFLDPDRSGTHYAEIEISPGNVTVDAHILSPLPTKKGDPPWKGDFDWDIAGLESRVMVHARGTKPYGWSVGAFVPWEGLRSLPSTRAIALPPKPGDRWRFNVFRIERPLLAGGKRGEVLLPWSPAPIPKFHVPAAFRDLVFH